MDGVRIGIVWFCFPSNRGMMRNYKHVTTCHNNVWINLIRPTPKMQTWILKHIHRCCWGCAMFQWHDENYVDILFRDWTYKCESEFSHWVTQTFHLGLVNTKVPGFRRLWGRSICCWCCWFACSSRFPRLGFTSDNLLEYPPLNLTQLQKIVYFQLSHLLFYYDLWVCFVMLAYRRVFIDVYRNALVDSERFSMKHTLFPFPWKQCVLRHY